VSDLHGGNWDAGRLPEAVKSVAAQALFVTVKTVEMHLGNAYRKLGINSRRQLAALLPPEKLQGASTGTTP
jgi:Bacterial regulatory proteins, luxR family